MNELNYPIKTSANEFTRLAIQSDLYRDNAREMLARIGDGSGMRVLDLCCGTGGITDVISEWVGCSGSVVGADFDEAKLEYARDWSDELGLNNVEYLNVDAFDSGLEPQSFDVVHARFALSVIRGGLGILDHICTLVKPGGVICVQEVNSNSMQCDPPSEDWDRAVQLCRDTFSTIGADVNMGIQLRRRFRERGLTDIDVKLCSHAQTSCDPMTMHIPLTLAATREAIISNGLMQGDKLEALIQRVADHLAHPDTMTISITVTQVVARAPVTATPD